MAWRNPSMVERLQQQHQQTQQETQQETQETQQEQKQPAQGELVGSHDKKVAVDGTPSCTTSGDEVVDGTTGIYSFLPVVFREHPVLSLLLHITLCMQMRYFA